MKKIIIAVLLTVLSGVIGLKFVVVEARAIVEGDDYEIVSPKASKEKEVYEFFSYACGACYSIEGVIQEFKKENPKVKVTHVPTDLGHAQWEIYVKAFYLGKLLKVIDKSHPKIFHMIHVEKKHFLKEKDLKKFFVGLGVDPDRYDKAEKSMALGLAIKKAKRLIRTYRVSGTPTLVANQRYKLNNQSLGSAEMIKKALVELTKIEK